MASSLPSATTLLGTSTISHLAHVSPSQLQLISRRPLHSWFLQCTEYESANLRHDTTHGLLIYHMDYTGTYN